MQSKAKRNISEKKSFKWGISSTSIDLMQNSHVQEIARDGCMCDCSITRELPKRRPPNQTPKKG